MGRPSWAAAGPAGRLPRAKIKTVASHQLQTEQLLNHPTPRPLPVRPSFWLPVSTLCWRELVRFYRQRSRVIGALGTPLLFWLLIGSGFGASFRASSSAAPAGMSYLEYLFPGTILLIVLFTAIFSTISVIEDRHEGFLLSEMVEKMAEIGRAHV